MAARIPLPTSAPPWLPPLVRDIERNIDTAPAMESFVVAEMPDPTARPYTWIFVTNASGGSVPAFSDGTNWRRVTDRAVVT